MHTELILQQLSIVHFKGIRHLTIDFNPTSHDIYGDNGAGKTTVADAIHWLLRGKNSVGEADFGIKPLDKQGKRLDKTQPDITGTFLLNERKLVLRHCLEEKWEKTKGADVAELKGNTHKYFVDGAPYTATEYKAFIDRIANDTVFPLITNPLFFNSDKLMPWQKRRELLLEIAGDITNEELAKSEPAFAPLVAILTNKTVAKYKAEVNANKKTIREQLDAIPQRVDEVRRSMPDENDYSVIETAIAEKDAAITEIDEQLTNATAAAQHFTETVRQHQASVRTLKLRRDELVSEIKECRRKSYQEGDKELLEKQRQISKIEQELASIQNSLDSLTSKIAVVRANIANAEKRKQTIFQQMEQGREAWKVLNAETLKFDENDFHCPACHQPLPEDDIMETKTTMEKTFKDAKAKKLAENVEKGKALKQEFDGLNDQIANWQREIGTAEQMVEVRTQEKEMHSKDYDKLVEAIRDLKLLPTEPQQAIEDVITNDPRYIKLTDEIEALEKEAPKEDGDQAQDLRDRKRTLQSEKEVLSQQLADKGLREKAEARVKELLQQEKDLASQLSELEGKENLIERFTKAKIESLTERVNSRFEIVRFKMFDYTMTGGVENTCEVMVDGVPYSDLNTAARINAGIDVINVLCEHCKVRVPIIIDNRESCVNIIDTNSQVINLRVKEGVKVLETHAATRSQKQGQLSL